MRILITGAAGFIGRHLERELAVAGHVVTGVDREDGDLTEFPVANNLIGAAQPHVVVHLAAQVGRLFGEDDVEHTIRSNAVMTTHVARAAAKFGASVVYASTSEVYGDQGEYTCAEDSPLELPHNLYGLSKRWGEEACLLYCPQALKVLRLSMPVGPGHPPGRGRAALTNMLWQAHTRQTIPVHIGAERSWCDVEDTVRGIRLIIERGAPGAYNVGRDDQRRSMLAIADMACAMTGASPGLIRTVPAPPRQTVVKRLATDRLRALGWEPRVDLEETMRRVHEYVKGFDREAQPAAA